MRCAYARGQLSGMSALILQQKQMLTNVMQQLSPSVTLLPTTTSIASKDAFQCISMYCAAYDNLAWLQLLQTLHNPGTSPGSADQCIPGNVSLTSKILRNMSLLTCMMSSRLWQIVIRHVLHMRSFTGCYVGHIFSAWDACCCDCMSAACMPASAGCSATALWLQEGEALPYMVTRYLVLTHLAVLNKLSRFTMSSIIFTPKLWHSLLICLRTYLVWAYTFQCKSKSKHAISTGWWGL